MEKGASGATDQKKGQVKNPLFYAEGKDRVYRKKGLPRTPFFMADRSPWPFYMSVGLYSLAISVATYLNTRDPRGIRLTIFYLVAVGYCWSCDIVVEGVYQGMYTWEVQRALRHGFVLFLFSELAFFGGFFWGFFHSAMVPPEVGAKRWPPIGIHSIAWWSYPLSNRGILVLSSLVCNVVHKCMKTGRRRWARFWLSVVICHGLVFLYFQYKEFYMARFTIADGIYGRAFYMLVGLHGLHVALGVVALFLNLVRLRLMHFSTERFITLRFAIWYWHFVDII